MIVGMNHFTVIAEDRRKTLDFYVGLLGLSEGLDQGYEELPIRLEHSSELNVVLFLQLFQRAGEVFVRCQQLPQAHECSHDFDIDRNGPRAAEDGRQHGDALFSEGVRAIARAAATV